VSTRSEDDGGPYLPPSLSKLSTLHGRKTSCPPHSPILVQAVGEGAYVASCLACGLAGPEREDGLVAKRSFDEASGALPRTPLS
jgi:hypothetical protein